jgi:two-component system OmpR family sensor kinase
MPEPRPRQPTLFAQIAVRLVAVAVVFAALDIGIVVANYARDQQAMAEDFVGQQAGRIERAWRGATAPGGAPAQMMKGVDRPVGVSNWGYVVVDPALRPAAVAGDRDLIEAGPWPTAGTLDWTRRDRTASGVRITGLRRFGEAQGPRWVLVSAETRGGAVYLPVIARELVDHVAVPLVPLMALLLAFNVVVVRRMLAPLSAAAAQVDALDASRMDARLIEPADSREVAALVAAVNRALERLQHAMALLKGFTADAAHELRTPLSVLRLRIEALPDGEARQRLQEDVQAMTRLVDQMLDLSQADALNLDQAREVDLHALAREVVAQTAPLAFAAGHDIRLTDQGAPGIPGHADALGRALRNLIENAIAHAGGDGPIEVAVGPGPRWSVRDHGQGLATTDPELIFRRFWRRRRDRAGGAGLGLGIARSIVEAHGGSLSAQNAPGGGAIFSCQFPAGVSSRDPMASPPVSRSTAADWTD